jgi:hypothetical protein
VANIAAPEVDVVSETSAAPSVVELIRHAQEIRALLADPGLTASQRRQLLALQAEVATLRHHAAAEAQRSDRFAQARWMLRSKAEHLADPGLWHLEPDQPRPSWWCSQEP